MAEPYALVCDPGIDAVALAVLVGLGAAPDLVVAVPGNVDLGTAARNAVGLVALLGMDAPVRSFSAPLRPVPDGARGSTHGDDGLGGQVGRLPPGVAAEPLAMDDLPGSVLTTGALTCVAAAVEAGRPVDRLVWMGGAIEGGNITAIAEFNAWSDPAATDLVLQAVEGARIVPLDVTRQVPLVEEDLEALAAGGPIAGLLADALRARPKLLVHDAVAAVAWMRPDLFDWRPMTLRCELSGALVADGGRPPVQVALDVDVEAVRSLIRAGVLEAATS